MVALCWTGKGPHQKLVNLLLAQHGAVHAVLVLKQSHNGKSITWRHLPLKTKTHHRILAQIALRTRQTVASIVLNVALFTLHRKAGVHHHLLLVRVRVASPDTTTNATYATAVLRLWGLLLGLQLLLGLMV
jgi:hypothetical protein